MDKVEVYRTNGDGQELYFTVTYDGEAVDISDAPKALQEIWVKYGIPYGAGRPVKPKEGEVFLKAVAGDFNGSIVRSESVVSDGE